MGVDDKEQIVRFAIDGDVIGHRGGFGSTSYYSISAETLEDSTLCYFSKKDLKHILLKNPRLSMILTSSSKQRGCYSRL